MGKTALVRALTRAPGDAESSTRNKCLQIRGGWKSAGVTAARAASISTGVDSSTIGIEYSACSVNCKDPVTRAPTRVRLKLWDAAGQDRFAPITRVYYSDVHVAILVYDCSDPKSVRDMLEKWWRDLLLYRTQGVFMSVVVIGTKSDLLGSNLSRDAEVKTQLFAALAFMGNADHVASIIHHIQFSAAERASTAVAPVLRSIVESVLLDPSMRRQCDCGSPAGTGSHQNGMVPLSYLLGTPSTLSPESAGGRARAAWSRVLHTLRIRRTEVRKPVIYGDDTVSLQMEKSKPTTCTRCCNWSWFRVNPSPKVPNNEMQ